MIILDGGMGRELQAMGAPFRQPEWSALALMEGVEYVRAAHDAFLQAGADVVTTNSYAIVPFHIGADVFAARATELLRLSGKLARAAADDLPRVVPARAVPARARALRRVARGRGRRCGQQRVRARPRYPA